jgi:hypothetical protein
METRRATMCGSFACVVTQEIAEKSQGFVPVALLVRTRNSPSSGWCGGRGSQAGLDLQHISVADEHVHSPLLAQRCDERCHPTTTTKKRRVVP